MYFAHIKKEIMFNDDIISVVWEYKRLQNCKVFDGKKE